MQSGQQRGNNLIETTMIRTMFLYAQLDMIIN